MGHVTWDPAWVQPFESVFSILQKFCCANVSTVRELQRTFGLESKREAPQNWSESDRDLHAWGALDPLALQRILRLSNESLETAVASAYVRNQEVKAVTTPRWRVCTQCLKSGFHSALYQLAFVSRCPMHQIDLQTACPSCGDPFPLYVLKKGSFTPPLGCPSCGMMWWNPSSPQSVDPSEHDRRTQALGEAHAWLTHRKALPAIEPNLWQFSQFGYDARGLSDRVRTLLHRWADVIGSPLPETLSVSMSSMKHYRVAVRNLEESQLGPLSDDEAWNLYRAFVRRFMRGVLRYHTRCIFTLGNSLWWNAARREVINKGICEYAYAFILWRMHWEKTEVPRDLFRGQARLWNERPRITCDWLPPDLPRLVRSRLFLLECQGTYQRCLRLARRLQQEGRLVFPLWEIGGTRKVEWIMKHAIDGHDMQLHWWFPVNFSELSIVPPHRTRRRRHHASDKLTCLAC